MIDSIYEDGRRYDSLFGGSGADVAFWIDLLTEFGAPVLELACGTGKYLVSDPGSTTQAQATQLAQSIFDDISGEFIHLEGTCLGDPTIKPGQSIKINKVGRRFSASPSGETLVRSRSHSRR